MWTGNAQTDPPLTSCSWSSSIVTFLGGFSSKAARIRAVLGKDVRFVTWLCAARWRALATRCRRSCCVCARLRATCAEGCWLGDFTGPPLGWGTSGACGFGSRGLRRRGARACARRQLWLLRTAVLLVPLLYIRGKGGTRLAQMLVRCSPFPHDPPINGLCSHELFVLARAVSATPPSIVIVALVLGGPERVRVVLNSSSSSVL